MTHTSSNSHMMVGSILRRSIQGWSTPGSLHSAYLLMTGPFQQHFKFGKQPKIALSHVGIIRNLLNQYVGFRQENMTQKQRMGRWEPWWSWKVPVTDGLFASHIITKVVHDFHVQLFGYVFALWCIQMMHHPKVNMTLVLLRTYPAFLALWMMYVLNVMTSPWFLGYAHKSMTHHQWSQCSEILRHSLRSLYTARPPDEVASTSEFVALVWISRTLFAWQHSHSKTHQTNPYPQLLCKFFNGSIVLHDQSAPDQWLHHFGF